MILSGLLTKKDDVTVVKPVKKRSEKNLLKKVIKKEKNN